MVTALVTGAASGIGKATVRALRASGMRVFALDVTAIDDVQALQADVTDPESIVRKVGECGERIDVLVNNAGILIEASLADMSIADLDRQLAVNVRGPFLVAQAVLPLMKEGGCIINVASELAYLGRANASAYAASKGAMLSMTRSWARELSPHIRVNAVAPGPIDTPLLGFQTMIEAEKALETANPMMRIGQPSEIAAVIAFLASPAASFMTGQCISADGGAAMH